MTGEVLPGWGTYETIGGGSGAGPDWHGTSAVHVHMTNSSSFSFLALHLTPILISLNIPPVSSPDHRPRDHGATLPRPSAPVLRPKRFGRQGPVQRWRRHHSRARVYRGFAGVHPVRGTSLSFLLPPIFETDLILLFIWLSSATCPSALRNARRSPWRTRCQPLDSEGQDGRGRNPRPSQDDQHRRKGDGQDGCWRSTEARDARRRRLGFADRGHPDGARQAGSRPDLVGEGKYRGPCRSSVGSVRRMSASPAVTMIFFVV